MRHITDTERRDRLARRHAVAPWSRVADAEAATRAMTVLHSTEPATVYLSCWARVDALTVADVDRALFEDRTLVKQLAMRRTLFVFPRDLLAAAWGSASARVADAELKRMAKDVAKAGLAGDGARWVLDARAAILAEIGRETGGLTAAELRERLPEVAVSFDVTAGSVWNHGRLLTHLGLTADLVRGTNTQHWRVSRPRWTLMTDWLGETPQPLPLAQGYAEIVGRWLRTFGPGTEDDLVWWLGGTKAAVRAALAAVDAVAVSLDGGATGWVLPDDVDPVVEDRAAGSWAALLPVLDPTVMGWKQRAWYLGEHGPALFDRNGNAGTTAWVDGRAVGCWVQDDDGVVSVHLLEDVPAAARRALDVESARLTAWLDGTRVSTVYPSPAMKAARAAL
ncbi:winged helix DNA-binding domain-containing protein [Nocardioides rubriscoriae]|uniref:winged helix DNA-binding domain-containing protein n=1 Tax=Nocardioides rubriscoriae TaxID=642762 RepID=UPI0011DF7471|nr:winged helix DNA-binding domain-containing protein [Nocardioides rubriscoriae]